MAKSISTSTSINVSIVSLFYLASCSDTTEFKVTMAEAVKVNTTSAISIKKSGGGSLGSEHGDKDGFNYYFTAYPPDRFQIEEVSGKENDYCRTIESNEVSDGDQHSELVRDMLIRRKNSEEVTIAIACHKKMYRFLSPDSIVSIQMVVEDLDDHVSDTVVFKIVR